MVHGALYVLILNWVRIHWNIVRLLNKWRILRIFTPFYVVWNKRFFVLTRLFRNSVSRFVWWSCHWMTVENLSTAANWILGQLWFIAAAVHIWICFYVHVGTLAFTMIDALTDTRGINIFSIFFREFGGIFCWRFRIFWSLFGSNWFGSLLHHCFESKSAWLYTSLDHWVYGLGCLQSVVCRGSNGWSSLVALPTFRLLRLNFGSKRVCGVLMSHDFDVVLPSSGRIFGCLHLLLK